MKRTSPIIRSICQQKGNHYHRPYTQTTQNYPYNSSLLLRCCSYSTTRIWDNDFAQTKTPIQQQQVQQRKGTCISQSQLQLSSSSSSSSSSSIPKRFTINTIPQHRLMSSSNDKWNEKNTRSDNTISPKQILTTRSQTKSSKDMKQEESNEQRNSNRHDDYSEKDTLDNRNKIYDYLGAKPQPDPKELQIHPKERKRRPLRKAIPMAWNMYKETWEGFFDNHQSNNEEERDDEPFIDEDKIKRNQKEIRKNLKKNIRVLKEDGSHVMEKVKETTGIRNKNDLVKWSMEQLKLANECVGEFMSGYRKGRDQEIDRVMNEYFKDFEMEGTDSSNSTGAITQHEEEETKLGRKKRRRKSRW